MVSRLFHFLRMRLGRGLTMPSVFCYTLVECHLLLRDFFFHHHTNRHSVQAAKLCLGSRAF